MNYTVEIYEKADGSSELRNYISLLDTRADYDKNARIQFKQISYAIELLTIRGTRNSSDVTKHIQDGIWELRPGGNRILYFFFGEDKFILLHMFRKKTQKTPKREIEKAKRERADYILRSKEV
ncbi:MAG: type II toxin-antitoxin system RelE/ParE family toxin [Lachnospiraceae bacterium]|jgi:phage-related protein|nr:type II toxin-antitoxin system RelE/ParE family toxin [Lachnospiraceae bacterium]